MRAPGLAVILVGDDPASEVYVRHKRRACKEVGIHSWTYNFSAQLAQQSLLEKIDALNADPEVDGILVQLPLPAHMDKGLVIERISPWKDVDGFHPYNMGRLALQLPRLRPCTPYGVIRLLESTGERFRGSEAVIVGVSNIVGRPMALELLLLGATVTCCNSATPDLAGKISGADIVIAAIGRPRHIKGAWIKPGAKVIDVGINRLQDGALVGDVEFEPASQRASWITPVPGGVGPMTIAMLLQNTLDICEANDP
jgi:methylenetetrahydrofolate dehydrogenase (NADP+)/methenyltetrahydrofolate cyclohydrolase